MKNDFNTDSNNIALTPQKSNTSPPLLIILAQMRSTVIKFRYFVTVPNMGIHYIAVVRIIAKKNIA